MMWQRRRPHCCLLADNSAADGIYTCAGELSQETATIDNLVTVYFFQMTTPETFCYFYFTMHIVRIG